MNVKRVGVFLSIALCVVGAVVFGLHQGLVFNSACLVTAFGLAGIAVTPVESDNNYKSWTLVKADADTATSFAHGFGAPGPDFLVPRSMIPDTTATSYGWGATSDATNIFLASGGAAGSGGDTPGTSEVLKIYAWRPHSAAR